MARWKKQDYSANRLLLFWHAMRDRSLLSRATSEANACRASDATKSLSFDTAKLCNQPLLQSSYAETLRMYVAVYIICKPEYEDAQVLDCIIPKDTMIVISSAMAHLDKRNLSLGMMEEHPVETFWADRFLTSCNNISRPSSECSTVSNPSASKNDPDTPAMSAVSGPDPREPKFSLINYSGSWVPLGGGIHQCPRTHWVKLQMLLSFAILSAAFDVELQPGKEKLRIDMAKYGLGALQPTEMAIFKIRRKEAAV